MYGMVSMFFFLFLDRKVRKDYWDVVLMYFEIIVLILNFYIYSFFGFIFVDWYCLLAFYEEVLFEEC